MPRKKAAPVAAVEQVEPPKATVIQMSGYRRRPLYGETTYDIVEPMEGYEPLKATIRINLSYEELEAIPFNRKVTNQEVWEAIAPHVTAWTVTRYNHETGDYEPVPPPAEAGWEVLKALDSLETVWLHRAVRFGYLTTPKGEEDRGKDSSGSESTPSTESDNDSASAA